MTHTVTLIPGDGTGPELAQALETVIDATGVPSSGTRQDAGLDVMDKYGTPLPEHVLDSVRRNKVAIKGPITTPVGTGFRSVNVALRKELDLYACLRPAQSLAGVRSRYARRRPGHRAREHRGPLRRHRAHGRRGRRREHQDHHAHGQRAHRALRLRVRPRATAAAR